jgi:hypothetical protein
MMTTNISGYMRLHGYGASKDAFIIRMVARLIEISGVQYYSIVIGD